LLTRMLAATTEEAEHYGAANILQTKIKFLK
jgi:hypothetical protein